MSSAVKIDRLWGTLIIGVGDLIELDIKGGTFKLLVESNILEKRTHAEINHSHQGIGRELFKSFREKVGSVETGASIFSWTYSMLLLKLS